MTLLYRGCKYSTMMPVTIAIEEAHYRGRPMHAEARARKVSLKQVRFLGRSVAFAYA